MSHKSMSNRGFRFSLQSSPPGRRQRIFAAIGAMPGSGFSKGQVVKKKVSLETPQANEQNNLPGNNNK